MDDVYTPTTDEIRAVWGAWGEYGGLTNAPSGLMDDHYAEFDRWLAAHNATVAAVAWDMAVASLVYEDGTPVEVLAVTDPYRNQNTQLGGH